jgi:tetratricopeptide (TPR) repeat protein
MQKSDYRDDLSQQLRSGRVALLCGAGISIASGLPSAMALASRICELISPLEASRRALLQEVCENHHIPFEAFIEIVIRVSGDASFLEMFSEGRPSLAHHMAAQLLKQHAVKTIGTTNFDLLFERAIAAVGVSVGAWRVFSTDVDFGELSDAVLSGQKLSLLKVHGSYGAGTDGMLTTLRQLGQRRLLEERMKAIDYLFRTGPHDLVLIIGYSCSDVFDISPRIESLHPPMKTVVLVQHSSSCQAEVSQPNAAAEFPLFKECDNKSWLIRTNTNNLLQELQERLEIDPFQLAPSCGDLWSEHVNQWFAKIRPSVSDRIVAAIFRRCGRYELAERHYELAIRTLRSHDEAETLADVLTQLGVLHQLWGNYSAALKAYNDALERLSDAPSRERSTALYQIGRVNEEVGDYRLALKKYEESMSIDEALGDQQGVASCLHQAGIIYQEYLHDTNEAESRYRRSLQIKSETGDLEGMFNTLHQLSILELIKDRHDVALSLNTQALDLALRLNLKHCVAYARSHRGYILQQLTRLVESESEHRECLRIREELNDVKGISRSYHRLSQIERIRGKLLSSLHLMIQAINLKRSINDRFGLAEDYLQVGLILEAAGHRKWALGARERSKTVRVARLSQRG